MVVILVHWLIKKGKESDFEKSWKTMSVDTESGLYREILTTIDQQPEEAKFHTFSLGDPFYSTYINIGVWESLKHFDEAIGKYIPQPEVVEESDGSKKITFKINEFEFKMRERTVLKVISSRGNQLPEAEIKV